MPEPKTSDARAGDSRVLTRRPHANAKRLRLQKKIKKRKPTDDKDSKSSSSSDSESETKNEESEVKMLKQRPNLWGRMGTLGGFTGDLVGDKEKEAAMDRLNLAGILNILDGVVDTPGRVLVMTSNHPEKLDSALIRPGRIDKSIYLGFMTGECAAEMIEHYFQPDVVTVEKRRRLVELLDGVASPNCPSGEEISKLEITPARLEQLCAEFDTVEEICNSLEKFLSKKQYALSKTSSVSVEGVLKKTFSKVL